MHERLQYSPYGYKRAGATWIPLPGEIHGITLAQDPEPARMDFRPECGSCNIAAHGFICHFQDGSCLRSIQEEGGPDYGVGDTGTIEFGETG